jgi:hypothetical protein
MLLLNQLTRCCTYCCGAANSPPAWWRPRCGACARRWRWGCNGRGTGHTGGVGGGSAWTRRGGHGHATALASVVALLVTTHIHTRTRTRPAHAREGVRPALFATRAPLSPPPRTCHEVDGREVAHEAAAGAPATHLRSTTKSWDAHGRCGWHLRGWHTHAGGVCAGRNRRSLYRRGTDARVCAVPAARHHLRGLVHIRLRLGLRWHEHLRKLCRVRGRGLRDVRVRVLLVRRPRRVRALLLMRVLHGVGIGVGVKVVCCRVCGDAPNSPTQTPVPLQIKDPKCKV